MQLLFWLVLALLAVDLAALLFGADTRPGFQHSSRRLVPHLSRRGSPSGWVVAPRSGRRANHG
jgi:hypothetical protein